MRQLSPGMRGNYTRQINSTKSPVPESPTKEAYKPVVFVVVVVAVSLTSWEPQRNTPRLPDLGDGTVPSCQVCVWAWRSVSPSHRNRPQVTLTQRLSLLSQYKQHCTGPTIRTSIHTATLSPKSVEAVLYWLGPAFTPETLNPKSV